MARHYGGFGKAFADSFLAAMKMRMMQDYYEGRLANETQLNEYKRQYWASKGLTGQKGKDAEIAGWEATGRGLYGGSTAAGGTDFERVKAALTGTESGGSYSIINSRTGATGRYQVMPFNIGSWTQKYLGHEMTRQEFRDSPAAQDKVFALVRVNDLYNRGTRSRVRRRDREDEGASYGEGPEVAPFSHPQVYWIARDTSRLRAYAADDTA